MAHDAFVSYSSKDKPVADAVVAGLEARGVRCWVAPRDITAGMNWAAAIIKAIGESRVMVLIYSGNANESPQIQREVERAADRNLPIVPFRIEPVKPSAELEYFLSTPHWLDAIGPEMEQHIDRLAEAVTQIVSGARPARGRPAAAGSLAAGASAGAAARPAVHPSAVEEARPAADRPASRVPLLIGGAAALLLVAGALAFLTTRGDRDVGGGVTDGRGDEGIVTTDPAADVAASPADDVGEDDLAHLAPPPDLDRTDPRAVADAALRAYRRVLDEGEVADLLSLAAPRSRKVLRAGMLAEGGAADDDDDGDKKGGGRKADKAARAKFTRKAAQIIFGGGRAKAVEAWDGELGQVRFEPPDRNAAGQWEAMVEFGPAGDDTVTMVKLEWELGGWWFSRVDDMPRDQFEAMPDEPPPPEHMDAKGGGRKGPPSSGKQRKGGKDGGKDKG